MSSQNDQPDTEKVKQLIKRLRNQYGDKRTQDIIQGLIEGMADAIYAFIVLVLTDEDLASIEKIADEAKVNQKIEELFKLRTNLTLDDVVEELKRQSIQNIDKL